MTEPRVESTIDTDVSVDQFFREVVSSVLQVEGFEATPATESYVAAVLADSAKPGAPSLTLMGDRSMTLMLAEALEHHGSERFQKLRFLGDGMLVVCGFFRDHLTQRGIREEYICGLGARAYGSASAMLRGAVSASTPDVFLELSENFRMFVQLVSAVSEELSLNASQGDGSLLELYERWQSSPSRRLTDLMLARGMLPQRATRGLN